MSAPDGFVRASKPVTITLNQPVAPDDHQAVTGMLLGAMHDRGRLLHYRVDLGDRTVLLAPPGWLHPDSRIIVVRAGLTVPTDLQKGMFVDTINEIAAAFRARRGWVPEDVA